MLLNKELRIKLEELNKYKTFKIKINEHDSYDYKGLYVNFKYFDIQIHKKTGNLMSPLGYQNYSLVYLMPDMQEYVNNLYEKAWELTRELYKNPFKHQPSFSNDKHLRVAPRIFDILCNEEHIEKVLDPKNYFITLLDEHFIGYNHEIEEIYDASKIFGKVICKMVER